MIICVSLFLMLRLSFSYTTFDDNVGFLKLKQDYIDNSIWKLAFYIHVFSSVFCLFAGLTQFSVTIQTKARRLHKIVGKAYVINILVINFPIAFIMAIYANGLWTSKIAFIVLDILWFWFTLKAYTEIRKGNISSHKRFMIRSFALTFSAITLRSWNGILSSFTELDALTIYMINAWIGFVPNLILAELIISKFSFSNLWKNSFGKE